MDYKPLADLIEPFLESPLDAVPKDLQERLVGDDGVPPPWDRCTPNQRSAIVNKLDKQRFDRACHGKAMARLFNAPSPTPEEAEEYAGANPLLEEIEACEIEIAEWEKIGDQSVSSEKALKKQTLDLLKAQLVALQKQFDVPCNDTAVTEPEPQSAPVKAIDATGGMENGEAEQAKPLQRTAAQDAAIICEIEKQGYNPLAMPRNPDGKPGAKADIRNALLINPLFIGSTVFDKAWERLTAHHEIVIKK